MLIEPSHQMSSLGQLSRRWRPNPPKKWATGLVTDVHKLLLQKPRVTVEFLSYSDYFDHVLWPFFDQDAMMDHIELILVLCLHEVQAGSLRIVDTLLDSEKFTHLLHRILTLSTDLDQNSNFRLSALIVKFLTQLVSRRPDHSAVAQIKLYVLGPFFLQDPQLIDDNNLSEQLETVTKSLESSNPAESAQFNLQVKWLRGIVSMSLELEPTKSESCVEFLRSLVLFLHTCINIGVVSVKLLVESVGIEIANSEIEPLVGQLLRPTPIDFSFYGWNESTLVDDQELSTCELLSLFPSAYSQVSLSYISTDDLLTKQNIDLTHGLKHHINNHMVDVLNRLSITVDRKLQLSIKGKSKYFSKIDAIKSKEGRLEITVPAGDDNSIIEGSPLLVIALGNPNKYSNKERERKYGLELLQVVQPQVVNRRGPKLQVWVDNFSPNDETLQRYNYIVRVPSSSNAYLLERYTSISQGARISGSLEHILLGKQEEHNSVHLDSTDSAHIPEETDGNPRKKIKLAQDSKISTSDQKGEPLESSLANGIEYNASSGVKLNSEQIEAVKTSLSNKLTAIQTPPHSGAKTVIKSIISSLSSNFTNERTLVILSSAEQVKGFDLSGSLQDFTCKVTDSTGYAGLMQDPYSIIEKLLTFAAELTDFLSLSEKIPELDIDQSRVLFEFYIKPKWKSFLEGLSTKEKTLEDYPFNVDNVTPDFESISKHYFSIVSKFEQLDTISTILNLDGSEEKVKAYLMNYFFKAVVVSPDVIARDLLSISTCQYDNVIISDSQSIETSAVLGSFINNTRLKRVVLLADPQITASSNSLYFKLKPRVTAVKLKQTFVESDTYKFYHSRYPNTEVNSSVVSLPMFVDTVSHVNTVTESKENVNVQEGEYIVKLYSTLTKIINDTTKVSIACMSPFQKVLIEEIARNDLREPPIITRGPDISTNDYVVVSLHHYSSFYDIINCVKHARRGVVFVGKCSELGVPAGDLKLNLDDKHKPFIIHKKEDFESYLQKIQRKKHRK